MVAPITTATNQLITEIAIWAPRVFAVGMMGWAVVWYYLRRERYRLLIGATVIVRLLYIGFVVGSQYFVWKQAAFTQLLLNAPVDATKMSGVLGQWMPLFQSKLGYFLLYSWGRFVMNMVLVLVGALLWYAVLRFLKKYKGRFFDAGEVSLGVLMALVVGWPELVIFVPMVLLSVVLVSAFRMIFLKESLTTLGWPMIVAATAVLILGRYLVPLLGLTVLKV